MPPNTPYTIPIQLALLRMMNICQFWHLILVNQCKQLKQCEKQFFQNKLTIYKASFVKKIINSRCYVDLSRRLWLKRHPKMMA